MEKEFKPLPDVECLKYHGTPEKPDIKIFVSHRIDFDAETIDNPLYIPVRCGAVYDEREGIEMLGDETGDNISEKRESFCELTVLYWAWKNIKADYYGLCHYRRYFCFGEDQKTDIYGQVVCDFITNDIKKKLAIENGNAIVKRIGDADIVLSTPFIVSNDPQKPKNLYDQYDLSNNMHLEDLETAVKVIREFSPEYYDDAVSYLNGDILYPCLLFIMKREYFFEFCEWIFPLLQIICQRLDTRYYSKEEKRAIGHIAERLLGVYITHLRNSHPNTRIKVLQRAVFMRPEKLQLPMPWKGEKNIPVVLASSDYFVPYTAMTIFSMLKNASEEYYYDIVILSTDMSLNMKLQLSYLLQAFPNAQFRIIEMTPYIKNTHFIVNGAHVSKETFYRLFVPELFKNYDRIIYLDSDLIVKSDISILYRLSLEGKLIAAVRDADFIGEYRGGLPTIKTYCDSVLKLRNVYNYFQAGVLIFNIHGMRQTFSPNELVDYAQQESFIYVDQDVLNKKCEGKVLYLDPQWNVMSNCENIRISQFISRAPENIYNDYMVARKNPSIIHYAGVEKPWNSPLSDFSYDFWTYARQTNFYEEILLRMTRNNALKKDPRSRARKIADVILPKSSLRREAVKRIIPKGSPQWNACKKIYYILRPNYGSKKQI